MLLARPFLRVFHVNVHATFMIKIYISEHLNTKFIIHKKPKITGAYYYLNKVLNNSLIEY